MAKPRKIIHQESIDEIPIMTVTHKEDLKGRIFTNDDISTAAANQMSRQADRKLRKAMYQKDRAASMVRHYNEDATSFNDRIK